MQRSSLSQPGPLCTCACKQTSTGFVRLCACGRSSAADLLSLTQPRLTAAADLLSWTQPTPLLQAPADNKEAPFSMRSMRFKGVYR